MRGYQNRFDAALLSGKELRKYRVMAPAWPHYEKLRNRVHLEYFVCWTRCVTYIVSNGHPVMPLENSI
jgi:hypothetical protein